jgi:CBS domain containing-hemolysin-like protein
MFELILALSLSIVVSAFCSVSEAAFYSVPAASVESMLDSGRKRYRYLKHIKSDIEKYIASILIINTFANAYGVYLATRAAEKLFSEVYLQLLPWILGGLILIFAEMYPKTLGVNYAKELAPILGVPFYFITKFLAPLIWITRIFTHTVTKDKSEAYSLGEIQSMASLSATEGSIDRQQALVIDNILSLDNVYARDIMTPRTVVYSCHKDVIIEKLISDEKSIRYSRIPIFDENEEHIIGDVLRRDIYDFYANNKGKLSLGVIMRSILYVPETAKVSQLLKTFLSQKQHMLCVVDEYGGFAGVLTLEDVIEEILGKEIVDEFDKTIDLQEEAKQKSEALKQATENLERQPEE